MSSNDESLQEVVNDDSKDAAIRKVVYDDANIRNAIANQPQTYNTILQHHKGNSTMNVVLRRRLSRLIKQDAVWKLRIPGTRFGLVIFCTPEHDYKIMVTQSLKGVRVFFMYDFESVDNVFVLNDYWELKGKGWSRWEYSSEPLRIKKFRCLKLWE